MAVKSKITELLKQLNNGVYEKEEVIALTLLSAVAGESIFLLGAPGVAKSLIARRLKFAFKDGKTFEYLMSRFSMPDEIFGPVSISKLKNEDKYERIVENYLPNADIVFLDEIWKAGPSIQNSLLTVINEKIFRNGEQEIKVPMKALISASNELPAQGEGLEALWDRFLVRLVVEGVQKQENFNTMISTALNSYEDNVDDSLKITDEDYKQWSVVIDKIEVPENVFNVIDVIRKKLQAHNDNEKNTENQIYISDRRWRKIVRLLRTSAFLNDRNAVDLMDCFLIKECLWNKEGQRNLVYQIVNESFGKLQFNFKVEIEELKKEIKKQTEWKEEVLLKVKGRRYHVGGGYNWRGEEYRSYYDTEAFYYELEQDYTDERNISGLCYISAEFYDKMNDKIKVNGSLLHRADFSGGDRHYLRKIGKSKIKIDNYQSPTKEDECQLKTITKHIYKKPSNEQIKEWDNRIFHITSKCRQELQQYNEVDYQQIKDNIFVNSMLVNHIEKHLLETEKIIEKFEIEIREVQNYYKNLKNEEKIIN